MKSSIFILVALCAIVAALAVPGQDAIDITVAGEPMVDGPMPHKRITSRELDLSRPSIAGHRGNCGEFPEHSMVSYASAIAHGADFIECDVVMTKDDQLICRHEPLLSNTTNADELFPDRITTYVIDGENYTGVFSVDLYMWEIRQLKVRERLYMRNQAYNDLFGIVSFEEQIKLVKQAGRVVGLYPETKHPTWHDTLLASRGKKKTITGQVISLLKKYGYDNPINSAEWRAKPVFLQSFESNNLKYARTITKMPIVQLMDDFSSPLADMSYPNYGAMATAESLAEIAKYANIISPWKETLQTVIVNANGTYTYQSTGLTERAQAAGMMVHIYTLRNEPNYHTKGLVSIASEYSYYFNTLGVNGGFTDFSGTLRPWMISQLAAGNTFPQMRRGLGMKP